MQLPTWITIRKISEKPFDNNNNRYIGTYYDYIGTIRLFVVILQNPERKNNVQFNDTVFIRRKKTKTHLKGGILMRVQMLIYKHY